MEVKDSVGNELKDGEAVTVIKDLKIKGMSQTIKRGTKVKNIRLTNNPQEVECRLGKSTVVLKTQFLKKA
jgi:protein PhnA